MFQVATPLSPGIGCHLAAHWMVDPMLRWKRPPLPPPLAAPAAQLDHRDEYEYGLGDFLYFNGKKSANMFMRTLQHVTWRAIFGSSEVNLLLSHSDWHLLK